METFVRTLKNQDHLPVVTRKKVKEGMLLIADISGYTGFVHNTDLATGSNIISELLSSIIDENILDLNIVEIEGDAVFFYRYGTPPPVSQILEQYDRMLDAFHKKQNELRYTLDVDLDLTLKLIVHYGEMSEFRIGNFTNLYGQVVLEAHRLLKNSVPSSAYVLLTDELIKASSTDVEYSVLHEGIRAGKLCEVYGGLRNMSFTYFDYEMQERLRLTA